mmetsp:Transcript_30193/g.46055  ORF Transcript_30193/g.46055 Transcript_30193/m.46055 type:complete len:1307 (-) Transcript_30193:228-4148(-)
MYPLHYSDLRIALSVLYSLPSSCPQNLTSQQAHDFLLSIQSRNVRRQLQSIQQSQIDMVKKGNYQKDDLNENSFITWGSSWLASVMVLLSSDSHPAERLFSAQTLMHRVRRVKLVEAIDLEIETPPGGFNTEVILSTYYKWISLSSHDTLRDIIADYFQSNRAQDEEKVKGELSLLTVAYIAYHNAATIPVDEHTQPLLTTLGATMSAISMRLRYTPQSIADNMPASPTPIVHMILQALEKISTRCTLQNQATSAFSLCACALLGAIPDTLLASPGGARGKFSIDPRCLVAAHKELRNPDTGVHVVWQATTIHTSPNLSLLWTFERWAKYLPLPWESFVQKTLDYLVTNGGMLQHPYALSYLIAIFEGASWKVDQIITFSLGLDNQNVEGGKKKQSSKSKKRQKDIVKKSTTDFVVEEAKAERIHRGDVACRTTANIWKHLEPILKSSPEGASCLCACANACFPYWTQHPSSGGIELIRLIMTSFQDICGSLNRNIRGLAYEPLCNLHSAMQETSAAESPFQDLMTDHLFQCSMKLATSCRYPSHYFDHMTIDSDEELEVERNDIRDVLRAISGGEVTYSGPPSKSSLQVLHYIVQACTKSILEDVDSAGLPHETAVHALTALAKPLNCLGEAFVRGELENPRLIEILDTTMKALSYVGEKLVKVLPTLRVAEVFPLSRIFDLGFASLCPALSSICQKGHFPTALGLCIQNAMHAAFLSLIHIPELVAESTLDHSPYDIRGAFRGPGGEDHVGILLFSRLANEGEALAKHVLSLGHANGNNLLQDLCKLHGDLKVIENERGAGIHYGKGVTPRTRRILLETISTFTKLAKSTPGLLQDGGTEADRMLRELFESAVMHLSRIPRPGNFDEKTLFEICEHTYDISAFDASLVSCLFSDSSEPIVLDCVSTMMEAGVYGYRNCMTCNGKDKEMVQWSRLRGALVNNIKASAHPGLLSRAIEALVLLTTAECEAIMLQCNSGPSSQSYIFNETIFPDDGLPTGAFVIVMADLLNNENLSQSIVQDYIRAASQCCTPVLQTFCHECPTYTLPSAVEPRAALCEAWFLTASVIAERMQSKAVGVSNDLALKLISESCCGAITLILFTPLQKDSAKQVHDKKGMNMDGPQTLAIVDFFEKVFLMDSAALHFVAQELQHRYQAQLDEHEHQQNDTALRGIAILVAILFRAASGCLPPWTIEGFPSIFAALYQGCGSSTDVFVQVVEAAMTIKLSPGAASGLTPPGSVLAGRFFEGMKEATQHTFLRNAAEISAKDTDEGWRRFKALLKQAAGGKKKASGFSQKPSPSSWDCDRL